MEIEVVKNEVHLVVKVPNSDGRLRIAMSIKEATNFVGSLLEAIEVAKTPE
jgi:hypothetical protein